MSEPRNRLDLVEEGAPKEIAELDAFLAGYPADQQRLIRGYDERLLQRSLLIGRVVAAARLYADAYNRWKDSEIGLDFEKTRILLKSAGLALIAATAALDAPAAEVTS